MLRRRDRGPHLLALHYHAGGTLTNGRVQSRRLFDVWTPRLGSLFAVDDDLTRSRNQVLRQLLQIFSTAVCVQDRHLVDSSDSVSLLVMVHFPGGEVRMEVDIIAVLATRTPGGLVLLQHHRYVVGSYRLQIVPKESDVRIPFNAGTERDILPPVQLSYREHHARNGS